MQMVIYFENKEFKFDDIRVPITVLEIKHLLRESLGSPVRQQRLFYFDDDPQQGPSLSSCKHDHTFVQDVPKIELVLTLGEVSAWAHFYVIFPPDQYERRRVHKVFSNRFASIAKVKRRIFYDTGLQVSYLCKKNGNLIDEDLNLFQCDVENGSILYCL